MEGKVYELQKKKNVMKRKAICGLTIFIVAIFIFQIRSLAIPETELNNEITESFNKPFVDSMRKYVLHFVSKKTYSDYVENHEVKFEYPNLKMVIIEDWLSSRVELEQIKTVDAVFDVTNTWFHYEKPPKDSERIYVSMNGVKTTLETKNLLNIQPVWDDGYKGDGIVFYDIDTGINVDHVDFQGRIMFNESRSFVKRIYGYNVDDDSISDGHGHGTHTAGIAAGAGIGNPDYIGMAPEASIIVGRTDEIPNYGIPTEALLAAEDYAINLTIVDVINFSIGGGDAEGLGVHELSIKEILLAGIVISCSAGNSGNEYYNVGSPGSTPQSIQVASTTVLGSLSTFSSAGPTASGYVKPDLAAPGQDIMSCGIEGADHYMSRSGTSMAAPHITGSTAIIIDALKDLGIQYNPGLIKAALMKSADPGKYNYLLVGAGIPDVADSLQRIQTAPTNGSGFPIILWAIPEFPTLDFSSVPQGFHAELFVESVSSTPYEDLAPVITGNISTIINLNTTPWSEPWTKNYYVTIEVPDNAALGVYVGSIVFETSGGVTASTQIEIEVTEGHSKILFAKKFTGWRSPNLIRRYLLVMNELHKKGIAVNEFHTWNITGERNVITAELLADYEAVWIADPFGYEGDFDTMEFWSWLLDDNETKAMLYNEIQVIQDFVAAGGGLFVNCQGHYLNVDYPTIGSFIDGYNATNVNEILEPYGITLSEELYEFEDPEEASVVRVHAITDGVTTIDHYGTSLSVTGDAQVLVKYKNNPVFAVYENDVGGRVVVSSANHFMDTSGYIEDYNEGTTNKQFTDNIFQWLVADEKIVGTYVEDSNGASFDIKSIVPSAILTSTLIKETPSGTTTTTVDLNEVSTGEYTYRLDFSDEGVYNLFVESADDKFLAQLLFDNSPPVVNTGGWTNYTVPDSARLDFSIRDTISIITGVSIKLNGENVDNTGPGKKTLTFTIITSNLEEGNNILHIIIKDAAGNTLDETYIIPTEDPDNNSISSLATILGIISLAAFALFLRKKRK
jgi:hypothetical protein